MEDFYPEREALHDAIGKLSTSSGRLLGTSSQIKKSCGGDWQIKVICLKAYLISGARVLKTEVVDAPVGVGGSCG